MRSDSTFVGLTALSQQFVVSPLPTGGIDVLGLRATFREVEPLTFGADRGLDVAFRKRADGATFMRLSAVPIAVEWERIPWYRDARFVRAAVTTSVGVILLTLLSWPVAAFVRRRRGTAFGSNPRDAHEHRAVRLALLLDVLVLVGAAAFGSPAADPSRLNAARDAPLMLLYGVAWLSVLTAPMIGWVACRFWRDGVGSRWAQIHHTLIAASTLLLAWFCVP
jgi:hypothetical protein